MIKGYVSEVARLLEVAGTESAEKVVERVRGVRERGGTVYLCGNGGSAATASHLANDLMKVAGVRAITLTDNVPLITAWSNDVSYESAFVKQLEMLIGKGDMVIGISTSGESENILAAMRLGRELGACVVSFTGGLGGSAGLYADINVCAYGAPVDQAEDIHLLLGHAICRELREA